MGQDCAISHSSRASTPLSFPSSVSSLASKTACATKTVLKSVKNAAKKGYLSPCITPRLSNASMVGSECSVALFFYIMISCSSPTSLDVHQESVGESGISSEKEQEDEGNNEKSDGTELSMCSVTDERYFKLIHFAERLSKEWQSAVYSLFKPGVKIEYDGERKYHFFIIVRTRPCNN